MKNTSLEALCQHRTNGAATELSSLLPTGIRGEVGHFNVFDLADLVPESREKLPVPYACRTYYKISLLRGPSRVEYADQVLELAHPTLLFSGPRVPFQWLPLGPLTGQFCVFTADFLAPTKSGVTLEELPIFALREPPALRLTAEQEVRVQRVFHLMQEEMASDYAYKYDLLRTYVLELIHLGQKLRPGTALHPAHSAAARLTSRFVELLERQFPLETPQQQLHLRTAQAFADQLAVHVNHLNKVLKETTGLTTTELIAGRVTQEAKILLRQTDWTIAQIADSLGFTDVAHFSNSFKRLTAFAPGAFRG
ncbi:MAG: helix-turn-helix transcriptional regulator [Hymenobacter sp.]|nr:helix-turn-helix transcriptional regulator [Hymenobacter sp.]